jgi:hypothetical protein
MVDPIDDKEGVVNQFSRAVAFWASDYATSATPATSYLPRASALTALDLSITALSVSIRIRNSITFSNGSTSAKFYL